MRATLSGVILLLILVSCGSEPVPSETYVPAPVQVGPDSVMPESLSVYPAAWFMCWEERTPEGDW